jgi:deoxyribodipyrimidine photolyase-related protein
MALHADGGLITTKPYICASNYLLKMSDFERGPWCEIWDGLFWRFLHKHRDFFGANPRLSVLTRQLDRMHSDTLSRHVDVAEDFLAQLK